MAYAALSRSVISNMQACISPVRSLCMQRRVVTQSAYWGRLPICTAHARGVVYKVDLYGNTLQRHPCPTVPHQIHSQWRCAASKVKDMPDKQFQETKDAADAAADDPGANDHFDKILDSLQTDASDKMNKAVSNAQEALAKQTVAGKFQDEHDSDERKAKKIAEEGKVAVRNIRRQVMQKIGKLARDGDISQDDQDRMTDSIQHLTDDRVDEIEEMKQAKQ